MKFRSETVVPHPREAVFLAYRDRLGEAVPYLDDIAAVNVLSREESGAKVTLHNEWVSDREVPKMAQRFLQPEHLRWDDYATWDHDTWRCQFEIKTRAFREAVRCVGSNTLLEDPAGTRIVLEGDFDVNLKEIPGVPRLLAGSIKPQVEKFIVSLITPNLEKTSAAVGRFLDAEG